MSNQEKNFQKKVSILIPCRNEIKHIENCIRSVCAFDPPNGGFEVIVIDGISNDGTRDILLSLKKEYSNLVIIDNPQKTVPYAMNLGIKQAKSEYIVRTDVRCVHPRSYLKDLIALSEQSGADNVGGVLVPTGSAYVQNSIAAAYKSPIAMGGALRDRGDFIGETDAVYGGCFRRKRLIEVGMYDEDMVRNQDDELSFRLRKFGGKVVQSGRIKIKYFPRRNFGHLFKQFLQYGYWKVYVLKKHPQQASLRHILPSLLVLGFLALPIAAFFGGLTYAGLIFYSISYLLALALESLRLAYKDSIKLWPGIILAIISIHMAFGAGFLIGFICRLFSIKPKWFESLSR